jgi:fucose permease
MITQANLGWWVFSYVMIGAIASELFIATFVFWEADGKKFRDEHPNTNEDGGSSVTGTVLRNRIVWICALFLLVYVGIEVSLGGWTVTFMIRVRGTAPFDAGISATAFWLGITIGRVVLGFVTGRIGEKLAILIYFAMALGLHLIFYLVPSIVASFLAVSLEGFFLGPMFPAAIVAATKLLPPHLHVSGVGFAAALGATGACVLPFAVGAIAQAKGVQVLMPCVLAFLVADAGIWGFLPNKGLSKAGKND